MYKSYSHKKRIKESIQIITDYDGYKIDLAINNGSFNTIKDLVVECDFFSESGTTLKQSDYTIYSIVSPKNIRHIEDFKIDVIPNQVKRIKCSLSDFKNYKKRIRICHSRHK